jgi:hypothetical protein
MFDLIYHVLTIDWRSLRAAGSLAPVLHNFSMECIPYILPNTMFGNHCPPPVGVHAVIALGESQTAFVQTYKLPEDFVPIGRLAC